MWRLITLLAVRVRAWCHASEAVRTFRIDRVLAARVSEELPIAPNLVDNGDRFSDSAALSITATAPVSASWVFDGLPGCTVTDPSVTGEVRATFSAGSVEWAVRWALAHCDLVEVTAPMTVCTEIQRRARAALTGDRHSGLPPQ
ncbi:MAG: WYL domain-containing protein [Actinobacteria bacterium]|nr:WYL domain-containing protein [Actinomycetota bacterium]